MDVNSAAYRTVFFILIIQVSLGLVNATGIFPVQTEFHVFDQSDIEAKMNTLSAQTGGFLGQGTLIGDALYFGLIAFSTMLDIIMSVFTAIPNALQIFFIPEAIANIIAIMIYVVLVVSVVVIAMNR